MRPVTKSRFQVSSVYCLTTPRSRSDRRATDNGTRFKLVVHEYQSGYGGGLVHALAPTLALRIPPVSGECVMIAMVR